MPPKFATALKLREKIEEYFESLRPKQLVDTLQRPVWRWQNVEDPDTGEMVFKTVPNPKAGETRGRGRFKITEPQEISVPLKEKVPVLGRPGVPTVAGLALFLGFKDYRSIYQNHYRDNPAYYAEIKKAFSMMGEYMQQQVIEGNTKGATFWLKNHGWIDKVETELYGFGGGAIETKDTSEKDRSALRHFYQNYGKRIT